MPRFARIAVPFLAAAIVAGVAATGGNAQTPSGRTIALTENGKKTTTAFVDTGKKGPSAGDTIVLGIPLTDSATHAAAGTATATCTVLRTTAPAKLPLFCVGVFALSDGDIMVAGRVGPGVDHLAVTGGTGAYAGARGTMTSTDRAPDTDDVLALLP
jgi:hypothetical protein